MKKITLLLLATTTVAFPMENPEEMKGFENNACSSVSQTLLPENIILDTDEANTKVPTAPISPCEATNESEIGKKPKTENIKEYLSRKNIVYTAYIIIPLGVYCIFKATVNKLVDDVLKRIFREPGSSGSDGGQA